MTAVAAIKTAKLQGQYEAAKEVNRVQLAVYFSIGKYLSLNTRNAKWGSAAIKTISRQLRKELPGLRGFSATGLKNMRKFFENWQMLDAKTYEMVSKSASIIADLQTYENQPLIKSASAIADLNDGVIDVFQAIKIPETRDFPVEDFFRVPFSHHIRIIEKNAKQFLCNFVRLRNGSKSGNDVQG